MIRKIKQRRETDCFPTCVAMVTGCSWLEAVKRCRPWRRKGTQYTTDVFEVVNALKKMGYKPVLRQRVRTLRGLRQRAIILIGWDAKNDGSSGHAIVWDPDRKQVIDPEGVTRSHKFYEKRIRFLVLIPWRTT